MELRCGGSCRRYRTCSTSDDLAPRDRETIQGACEDCKGDGTGPSVKRGAGPTPFWLLALLLLFHATAPSPAQRHRQPPSGGPVPPVETNSARPLRRAGPSRPEGPAVRAMTACVVQRGGTRFEGTRWPVAGAPP